MASLLVRLDGIGSLSSACKGVLSCRDMPFDLAGLSSKDVFEEIIAFGGG